jgi:hypothetical protein
VDGGGGVTDGLKAHSCPRSARLSTVVTRPLGGLVEMGRMILAYRSLMKTHQQLLNKYRGLSEASNKVFGGADGGGG